MICKYFLRICHFVISCQVGREICQAAGGECAYILLKGIKMVCPQKRGRMSSKERRDIYHNSDYVILSTPTFHKQKTEHLSHKKDTLSTGQTNYPRLTHHLITVALAHDLSPKDIQLEVGVWRAPWTSSFKYFY